MAIQVGSTKVLIIIAIIMLSASNVQSSMQFKLGSIDL